MFQAFACVWVCVGVRLFLDLQGILATVAWRNLAPPGRRAPFDPQIYYWEGREWQNKSRPHDQPSNIKSGGCKGAQSVSVVQDLAKQPLEVFCGCRFFCHMAKAKYIKATRLVPVATYLCSVPCTRSGTFMQNCLPLQLPLCCLSVASQLPLNRHTIATDKI